MTPNTQTNTTTNGAKPESRQVRRADARKMEKAQRRYLNEDVLGKNRKR